VLHAVQISFYLDPRGREPEQLLQDWPSLVDVAEAAALAGVRISVIQASAHPHRLTQNGVDYHFVAPEPGSSTIAGNADFAKLLRTLSAQVFHVHGMGFPADVLTLANLVPDVPIIVQDHANRTPRTWWRRRAWRRGLAAISGAAFCSTAQAKPFMDANILDPRTTIYEVPESTSRFTPGDRDDARRLTGLHGDPCLLWVGHLDRNKDPLTVLDGVSEAARRLPGLELWCCFGAAPLIPEVQRRIDADPVLRPRVHLLGRVPHERIEALMRAADVFVLGSHREGSGYALIEALACGLPPVVTEIPSFRSLVGQGPGRLWPCGDAAAFRDALLSLVSDLQADVRSLVRAHFDAELSFAAVGRKLGTIYRHALERSSQHASRELNTTGAVGAGRR
jgi:glycosyltransferase involved in cell wall biosynthesis